MDSAQQAFRRTWIPFDVSDLRTLGRHLRALDGSIGVAKLGLELIHAVGTPRAVSYVDGLDVETAIDLFVDGKLDDIPTTVAKATKAIADQGVDFLNVHASAGRAALDAAYEKKGRSKLLVVTVLTSLTPKDLYDMYVAYYPGAKPFGELSPEDQKKYLQDVVLNMAIMAAECGCDGLICSPQELAVLAQDAGLNNLARYTPGVRPTWADANDQKRVMTPGEAIRAGATGVIIGRPILQPPKEIGKPIDAARLVAKEIAEALGNAA